MVDEAASSAELLDATHGHMVFLGSSELKQLWNFGSLYLQLVSFGGSCL